MADYLLFIDTEASGLPKNWSLPYSDEQNWPFAVQIAWVIYDRFKNEIKRENFFIRNDGSVISEPAIKIHGIDATYLAGHGVDRGVALSQFSADLAQYSPLVIGHFLKFDYYVLGADFFRVKIENPLPGAPVFCTMVASGGLRWNIFTHQLKLGQLFHLLFKKELENQHNALYDALATAECFFELMNNGEITQKTIDRQNAESQKWRDPTVTGKKGCVFPLILIVMTIGLLIYIALL